MDNRAAYSTNASDSRKADSIHRWLQHVRDGEPPEEQPPFNHRGELLHPNSNELNGHPDVTSSKPEKKQQSYSNKSTNVQNSFLTINPPIHGTGQESRRPSNTLSSHSGPGREVYVSVDQMGKRLFCTDERPINLQAGEMIDPSGETTQSICPTFSGRTRSLSRSNALKESEGSGRSDQCSDITPGTTPPRGILKKKAHVHWDDQPPRHSVRPNPHTESKDVRHPATQCTGLCGTPRVSRFQESMQDL
ncbi:hypothetical protein ACLMJK_005250 [Lecanora helva]